jgi:hypothetical protein
MGFTALFEQHLRTMRVAKSNERHQQEVHDHAFIDDKEQ